MSGYALVRNGSFTSILVRPHHVRLRGNLGNAVVRFPIEGIALALASRPTGKSVNVSGARQPDPLTQAPESTAPKNEFHEPFQRDLGRPDCASKIFRFSFSANQFPLRAIPPHEEGRTRRHDTWSAGCGGREGARAREALQGGLRLCLGAVSDQSAQDERRYCVRQKRVVLAPVAGVKLAEVNRIQPDSMGRQSGSDG